MPINDISYEQQNKAALKGCPLKVAGNSLDSPLPQVDPVILAYLLITRAVLVNNQTAQVEAKQMQTNAEMQNKLIQEQKNFNFLSLPYASLMKATVPQMLKNFLNNNPDDFINCQSKVFSWAITHDGHLEAFQVKQKIDQSAEMAILSEAEMFNQSISAERSYFESQLTIARQSSQNYEANASSSASRGMDGIQEGSSIMDLLLSVTSRIGQM